MTELEHERELSEAKWKGHEKEHLLNNLALSKAEESMKIRLEHMNEFRTQLEKQQDTFCTKDMLIPFRSFIDRFNGIIFGITLMNIAITTAINIILRVTR